MAPNQTPKRPIRTKAATVSGADFRASGGKRHFWDMEQRNVIYMLMSDSQMGLSSEAAEPIFNHIFDGKLTNGPFSAYTINDDWVNRKNAGRSNMYRTRIEKDYGTFTEEEIKFRKKAIKAIEAACDSLGLQHKVPSADLGPPVPENKTPRSRKRKALLLSDEDGESEGEEFDPEQSRHRAAKIKSASKTKRVKFADGDDESESEDGEPVGTSRHHSTKTQTNSKKRTQPARKQPSRRTTIDRPVYDGDDSSSGLSPAPSESEDNASPPSAKSGNKGKTPALVESSDSEEVRLTKGWQRPPIDYYDPTEAFLAQEAALQAQVDAAQGRHTRRSLGATSAPKPLVPKVAKGIAVAKSSRKQKPEEEGKERAEDDGEPASDQHEEDMAAADNEMSDADEATPDRDDAGESGDQANGQDGDSDAGEESEKHNGNDDSAPDKGCSSDTRSSKTPSETDYPDKSEDEEHEQCANNSEQSAAKTDTEVANNEDVGSGEAGVFKYGDDDFDDEFQTPNSKMAGRYDLRDSAKGRYLNDQGPERSQLQDDHVDRIPQQQSAAEALHQEEQPIYATTQPSEQEAFFGREEDAQVDRQVSEPQTSHNATFDQSTGTAVPQLPASQMGVQSPNLQNTVRDQVAGQPCTRPFANYGEYLAAIPGIYPGPFDLGIPPANSAAAFSVSTVLDESTTLAIRELTERRPPFFAHTFLHAAFPHYARTEINEYMFRAINNVIEAWNRLEHNRPEHAPVFSMAEAFDHPASPSSTAYIHVMRMFHSSDLTHGSQSYILPLHSSDVPPSAPLYTRGGLVVRAIAGWRGGYEDIMVCNPGFCGKCYASPSMDMKYDLKGLPLVHQKDLHSYDPNQLFADLSDDWGLDDSVAVQTFVGNSLMPLNSLHNKERRRKCEVFFEDGVTRTAWECNWMDCNLC